MATDTPLFDGQPTLIHHARRDPITAWLLLVGVLVVVMVIVGGYTRLSRAGLSIVEWDAVTGVVPPIGQDAWQESFEAYQQTPEYQHVNAGMSLHDYKMIYYVEWAHRLIARIAGFAVILPLLWFMWKKVVTPRESIKYWLVAAGFGIQGAIGWVMVSSGLEDRPMVSDVRLTIHLLAAVALLAVVLWMALGRYNGAVFPDGAPAVPSTRTRRWAWALVIVTLVQLAYGGLVAGMKAGHVSDTWPLMDGRFVPSGLLTGADGWLASLFEPLGVHWTHRWLAFAVAGAVVVVFAAVQRDRGTDLLARRSASWLLWLVWAQVALGIITVLAHVPKFVALAHQGVGILLFSAALILVHRAQTLRSPVGARNEPFTVA